MKVPAVKEKSAVVVVPFGIEADAPRNNQLLLQCVPGAELRSAIDGSKPVVDRKTGDFMLPKDQANHLASFPKAPGMQIYVNPAALTYEISDPLYEDDKMCERITKWMKNNIPFDTETKVGGAPPLKGSLDQHRMKTLCRELFWLVDAGDAKRCQGVIPTLEDIEELPGEFLLNPGSRIGNTQPQFECNFDNWVTKLANLGG